MLQKYFRLAILALILCSLICFGFYKHSSMDSLSGFAFGVGAFTFNVSLSVFLFSRLFFANALKGNRHRLALLLAISAKGVNLLVLTYLGIQTLDLGVLAVVFGANFSLMAHVVFFFLYSKNFFNSRSKAVSV